MLVFMGAASFLTQGISSAKLNMVRDMALYMARKMEVNLLDHYDMCLYCVICYGGVMPIREPTYTIEDDDYVEPGEMKEVKQGVSFQLFKGYCSSNLILKKFMDEEFVNLAKEWRRMDHNGGYYRCPLL